uniref:Protocadherin Fat 1-like n=1 Tax=Saccoglossus kowalevskii TaxID=10224 RepID=A0ABM0M7U1_SACKO|nr:PREDICTED: protocadherin Fat 1-like [Saccoglossus kowalevskii]
MGIKCRDQDPCEPNPCQHDGECSITGDGYKCKCSSDWQGSTCNNLVPNDSSRTTGIIVGCVMLGIAAILLFILIVKCQCKQTSKNQEYAVPGDTNTNGTQFTQSVVTYDNSGYVQEDVPVYATISRTHKKDEENGIENSEVVQDLGDGDTLL